MASQSQTRLSDWTTTQKKSIPVINVPQGQGFCFTYFHLSERNTKPGTQTSNKCLFKVTEGFPGGLDGNESDCNAGDAGSIPGSGRSPGGNGSSLQYSCLEKFMDRGYSPWGRKESDTTGRLTLNKVTEVGDSRQGQRGRLIFSCGGCLNAEKPQLGKLSLRTTRGATK